MILFLSSLLPRSKFERIEKLFTLSDIFSHGFLYPPSGRGISLTNEYRCNEKLERNRVILSIEGSETMR